MKTNDELYSIILKLTQAVASSATATAALLSEDRKVSLSQLKEVESALQELKLMLPDEEESVL